MRQRCAPGVAGGAVKVETEGLSFGQGKGPVGKAAQPELGTLQVEQDGDRPPQFPFQRADGQVAFLVFVMAAVAEIEPEYIRAGLVQAPDLGAVAGGRAQGGDDFGIARTALGGGTHEAAPIRMARKSLTLVLVGPVMSRSPSFSKKL